MKNKLLLAGLVWLIVYQAGVFGLDLIGHIGLGCAAGWFSIDWSGLL
jgi:hypothetical protein